MRLRRRRGRVGNGWGERVGCVVCDVIEANDELPVALAYGPLGTEAPVEGVVWRSRVLAAEIRAQIDAVELPIGGGLAAGGGDGRRQNVERDHGLVIDLAGGHVALP